MRTRLTTSSKVMRTYLSNQEGPTKHVLLKVTETKLSQPVRVQLLTVHHWKQQHLPSKSGSSHAKAKLWPIVCTTERVIGCQMASVKGTTWRQRMADCCQSSTPKETCSGNFLPGGLVITVPSPGYGMVIYFLLRAVNLFNGSSSHSTAIRGPPWELTGNSKLLLDSC